MSQFAGKTAVISGGAEGIGLSIAQALGDQKMNIVIADIDQENLQKAGSELEACWNFCADSCSRRSSRSSVAGSGQSGNGSIWKNPYGCQ